MMDKHDIDINVKYMMYIYYNNQKRQVNIKIINFVQLFEIKRWVKNIVRKKKHSLTVYDLI